MTNLGWLRSRIWIALALPAAAGCKKDVHESAAPPVPKSFDAAAYAKPSVDAAPTPDAAVIADAAPPPAPDAATKTARMPAWNPGSMGCGGTSWCTLPADAEIWATSAKREDGCPVEIEVPNIAMGEMAKPGKYAVHEDDSKCCFREPYRGSPCKGRPFLDGERAVVADADPGADAWVAAALDEHASVASFARATLELMAVGAPPALIAGCQHAALDEIAHAQGCFAMAARRGCAVEPGPIEALAPRGGGLAAVARDTFVEGCVGETIGALLAAAQRDAATDPEERALMTRIADDEARHAELAWQTVAWAISRDASVASTLRAAADRARDASPVWRDVIDPTLAALLG